MPSVGGSATLISAPHFGDLLDVLMTGVTNGQVPAWVAAASRYEPLSLPVPLTDYVVVSVTVGPTIAPNVTVNPAFDQITAKTGAFTVEVGDNAIIINQPGVYFAVADGYLDSGTMTGGQLYGAPHFANPLIGLNSALDAADSTVSTALGFAFQVVTTTGSIKLDLQQTSSGSIKMDGDLLVMRLGPAAS